MQILYRKYDYEHQVLLLCVLGLGNDTGAFNTARLVFAEESGNPSLVRSRSVITAILQPISRQSIFGVKNMAFGLTESFE